MRSFIVAVIAAVVLAVVGAMVLNSIQEPVSVAFTTKSAKI